MVCPHVAAVFWAGERPTSVDLTIGDFLIQGVFVCEICLNAWSRAEGDASREEFISTILPVCSQCFHERVAGVPVDESEPLASSDPGEEEE